MILSHKHKFIFIKTAKTAGTSIEIFLSRHCGEEDVVTPFGQEEPGHVPRNHQGFWNPFPEFFGAASQRLRVFTRFLKRRKFYNHMTASSVRFLVADSVWTNYYKFCVERNPWEKTLSHYHMMKEWKGEGFTMEKYFKRGKFPVNFPSYTCPRGTLMVDKVIKYECLKDGLSEVFGRLGIPFDGSLGVKAKSGFRKDRTPYQQVFNGEQRTILDRVFRQEIDMHGYQF